MPENFVWTPISDRKYRSFSRLAAKLLKLEPTATGVGGPGNVIEAIGRTII